MKIKISSKILITILLILAVYLGFTRNSLMAQDQEPAGSGGSVEIEVLVNGRVTNGTVAGSGPGEQEVALNRIVGERAEGITSVKSDSSGRFSFPVMKVQGEIVHFLSTNYKGVIYFSAALTLNDKTQVNSEVVVYETTESDENIKVEAHHIVIENVDNSLQIREFVMFANVGDRTYIGSESVEGDGREVLMFIMPQGIVSPEINQGIRTQDLVNTQDGFADGSVFRAGTTREIIFSYRIPYTSSEYEFSKLINYPTDAFQFLVADNGIIYRSDNLTDSGPAQIGDNVYLAFAKRGVVSGEAVTIMMSELPLPRDDNFIRLIIIGSILGLGIIGLSYYLFVGEWRGAYAGSAPSGDGGVEDIRASLEEKRGNLIQAVASLDDAYASGGMNEGNYRRQRAVGKEEIVQLTYQLKALGRRKDVSESET